jgi:hypothetical protein
LHLGQCPEYNGPILDEIILGIMAPHPVIYHNYKNDQSDRFLPNHKNYLDNPGTAGKYGQL